MTLRNPKLFGLDVNSNLADIVDKNSALSALNLRISDLDVIRGSANIGANRHDWVSFSRLTQPLYRTLDRFLTDSSQYLPLLQTKSGTDGILFGNLDINGRISGNAIRYRYIDGTGSGASPKIADISTSRVSAWSSSASPVIDTSPISYGARVGIITGGALQFGTAATSGQVRLQTTMIPQSKEFDSEFPTHKINCTIGGESVTLYAMKGVPLSFTGFFRNLDATITLTELIGGTSASWKIVDTDDANSFVNFKNQGGTSTSINFRSSRSKERYIQFYYNPDNILTITINSASITEIPEVKFSDLSTLNLSYNNLKNFPNLNFISPKIKNLYLVENPFYLSETANERSLNANVVNKIPANLKELYLGGTFNGSIPLNLIGNRFTGLSVLNLSRGGGGYFYPDDAGPESYLPNVPNSCETYNVYNNDFRTIGATTGSSYNVKELTDLISLTLHGNYYLSDANFSISSNNNKIQYIDISSTALPCPDLSGKQSLITFYGYYARAIGSIFNSSGTYKFDGCGSLSTLYFYASPLTGRMPKFTNAKLTYLELRYTSLTGGNPNGDNSFVIPEKTFEQSTKLQYMLLQSGNLLESPIHPNAFTYTPDLYYLWYISYGRTTGSFPNLSVCSKLAYLVLHYNNFSGSSPNFTSNPNIYYVDISYNSFSGNVPGYKNLSNLTYLYLYNNSFTGITQFQNLPNLTYLYLYNNQITGEIPDFGDCPSLYYLLLNNNKFTNYKSGSFTKLFRINYIDLSNNLLTGQAINKIIDDLYTNYKAVTRGGITVNLRGNNLPSGTALETIEILKSKGWSIVYE